MGVKLRELNSEWNAGEKVYSDDLNDTFDYKLNKDEVYTDGISAKQLLSNSSVEFGKTDATGNNNKIYQSFIAGKDTIKSITLKVKKLPTKILNIDSDGSVLTYSETDASSGYAAATDEGIVSGQRKIKTVYKNNNFQVIANLSKTYSGLSIGDTYKISFDLTFNTTATVFGNKNKAEFLLDSTVFQTLTDSTAQTTYDYTFVATSTSHTVKVRLNTTTTGNYYIVSDSDLEIKNIKLLKGEIDSDINIKIFADSGGTPTGSALVTATILASTYNSTADDNDIKKDFSSILSVQRYNTYWIELSQATPNDNAFVHLAYQNTTITGFTLNKWNTADGYVAETGALYLKVSESEAGKLATMDTITPDYFGDGSDGDVVISTNTTLTRDMYYNNLTVNSGVTLTTGNYKIFVKETLTNNGIIKGILLTNGGARKQWNEDGVNVGGNGFFGGNGGSGGGGAAGGLGYIKSDDEAKDLIFFMNTKTVSNLSKTLPFIYASNVLGGGGGTSGNSKSSSSLYYGGKGGGGGGIVFICARNITGTGSFDVAGEVGENSGGGGATGGGGGGGGCIIFFYETTSNSFTYNLNGGNGGTPSGGNGGYGKVYQIKV